MREDETRGSISRSRTPVLSVWAAASLLLVAGLFMGTEPRDAGADEVPAPSLSGEQLYRNACAACHGVDGRGAAPSRVAFEEALPDFTGCSFASREPDADWIGVAYEGGPTRGFSRMMPAFGDAMTTQEIQLAMDHVRTFCGRDIWPRGELNFPRAMFTEKAYPEDEAVFTTTVSTDRPVRVEHELVFEKRLGAFSQLELVVPFEYREQEQDGDDWTAGIRDIAVGFKTAPLHSYDSGTILALTGELILPTGNADQGFGKGTTIFEPFLSVGQDLRAVGFLQFQGGMEIPFLPDKAEMEAFWRGVYGRTFTQGQFGRAWTPMVEVLGARELEEEATVSWDVVPQMQVTLNTRQHVMLNVAARIPLTDFDTRDTDVLVYLLWDWFDGGFLEGW